MKLKITNTKHRQYSSVEKRNISNPVKDFIGTCIEITKGFSLLHLYLLLHSLSTLVGGQVGRLVGRWVGRRAGRRAGRQTDKQVGWQIGGKEAGRQRGRE